MSRRHLHTVLVALALLPVLIGPAAARPSGKAPAKRAAPAKKPAPPPATAAPAPAPRFAWPGGDRAALELPAEAWKDVTTDGGLPPRPLGFTLEEMKNYGRDRLILRTVENLFRDARTVPRFSGRVTDEMLAVSDPAKLSVAELVRQAYVLTDVAAGRMYPAPTKDTWGVDWLPAEAAPPVALDVALERCAPPRGRIAKKTLDAAMALPEPVQRAVARCLIGAETAAPWLELAFEGLPLPAASRDAGKDQDALYALAAAPWKDETNDQTATLSKDTFTLLEKADRDYLAYGSVIFLLHAGLATEELRAWCATPEGIEALSALKGLPLEIPTRFGIVRVAGNGSDAHDAPAFLDVDLGGDDRWTGRHGVPQAPASRIALAIDVSGNDAWDGGERAVAIGCGLFGVGAVIDCAGDDTWRVDESGLGAAWFGTGVVADLAGRDAYVVKDSWGEGAAHAGVGLLLDVAGDDTYGCAQQSQGLGSTLGAGVLIDVAGNDRYVARDDGNISPLYLGQSVAMAQGCGYGRRADLGDGHSLAGGFGVLVDAAGDDFYHSQVWSQGAGYWWSCGILEDRAGNDTYENGKYSWGAGAHFAIGCAVDLAGNDSYNTGVETSVNQFHGHARDGSMGIAIDGDGDDRYFFRNNCGGSADLDSVGLFWDRRGDDRYDVALKDQGPPNGWNETPPMGSSTWYPLYRSWRDDIPTTGVFLDTGGKDTYSEAGPGREGKTWTRPHAPASFGVGMDAAWYPAAGAP